MVIGQSRPPPPILALLYRSPLAAMAGSPYQPKFLVRSDQLLLMSPNRTGLPFLGFGDPPFTPSGSHWSPLVPWPSPSLSRPWIRSPWLRRCLHVCRLRSPLSEESQCSLTLQGGRRRKAGGVSKTTHARPEPLAARMRLSCPPPWPISAHTRHYQAEAQLCSAETQIN